MTDQSLCIFMYNNNTWVLNKVKILINPKIYLLKLFPTYINKVYTMDFQLSISGKYCAEQTSA